MPTYNARHINSIPSSAIYRMVSFSGTVKNLTGSGLARNVLLYKHDNNVFMQTRSDADDGGNWAIDIPCGSNDRIRAIVVGGANSNDNSENSDVWDKISGE